MTCSRRTRISSRQVFSEQEVAEIIQAAFEHQAGSKAKIDGARHGLVEEDIRKVAGELGISEDALNAALAKSRAGASDSGSLDSTKRILERSVDEELEEEDFNAVYDAFPPNAAAGGAPVKLGGVQTYHSAVGMAVCQVSVRAREGKSVLKVDTTTAGAWALAGFGWFLGTLAIIVATALTRQNALLLLLLGLYGGGYFGVKSLIRSLNQKVLSKVNEAAANLAKVAGSIKLRKTEELSHSPRAALEADQDVQQTSI